MKQHSKEAAVARLASVNPTPKLFMTNTKTVRHLARQVPPYQVLPRRAAAAAAGLQRYKITLSNTLGKN